MTRQVQNTSRIDASPRHDARQFEKYCIDEFQEEAEAQGLNKHKCKKTEPDKPLPSAKHELWDDNNNQEEHKTEVTTIRLPVGLKGLAHI
jgi:hypothetical protein